MTTKDQLNEKLKQLNLISRTQYHLSKDLTGYKLENSNYHEITRKRLSANKMYDFLDWLLEYLWSEKQ